MEKNLSEDIDSSFELFDPITSCVPDSMSIVAIPEPKDMQMEMEMTAIANTSQQQMSTTLPSTQSMQSNGFNIIGNNLDTRRLDSIENSLPDYNQIENNFLSQKIINISDNESPEDRKASIQTLSDNLNRIEDNVKNCSNAFGIDLTNNLENYLKEMRDENEKLKTELEKNNQFMRQQLKNLHEWQSKNNEIIGEHKRISDESKQMSKEILSLKEENFNLKDKVLELEGMAGLKLTEQLSEEVETLRSKCDQLSTYGKLNVNSELKSQEMCSQVSAQQIRIDAMTAEIKSLRNQLSDSNSKLENMSAMESQLYIFERDFKLEEMSKMAALKEVEELEREVETLKKSYTELEERVEKGEPIVDLKPELTGKTYSCPKCWRSFERFQAIQNHFEQCLEEDGLFT